MEQSEKLYEQWYAHKQDLKPYTIPFLSFLLSNKLRRHLIIKDLFKQYSSLNLFYLHPFLPHFFKRQV